MGVSDLAVSFADVLDAAERLRGVAHRTPALTSRTADARVGARVFFKCENFQRAGAFKFRGAYNALAPLSDEQKRRGVITYSSGNHGQAIALAARLLDIPATVVMPRDAPQVKLAAVQAYGAEVLKYEPSNEQREVIARALAKERGLTMVPPFDHPHIIAGQGTAALELIEDVGALDYLLVCVGGGGLISGCAIAAHALAPGCKVIGVEPQAGDDGVRSFRSKSRVTIATPDTIADGARTACLGELTLPIILAHVHDMISVADDALVRAMRFFAERMKMIVEPTGALAAAALFELLALPREAKVGVVVSGGNVDLRQFNALLVEPPVQ